MLHNNRSEKRAGNEDSADHRPTEVDTPLGDPGKARRRPGWEPRNGFEAMMRDMVAHDPETARRHQLLASHGYNVVVHWSER